MNAPDIIRQYSGFCQTLSGPVARCPLRYHARNRMARRAQHLRCSLCEGSERADNKLDNPLRSSPARASPNQVLTHAARAAASQPLFSGFSATLWPRAARAKGPGQGNARAGPQGYIGLATSKPGLPDFVWPHAAREAAALNGPQRQAKPGRSLHFQFRIFVRTARALRDATCV